MEAETCIAKREYISKRPKTVGFEVKPITRRMIQKLASEGPEHLIILNTMSSQGTVHPVDHIMALRITERYRTLKALGVVPLVW